MSGFDYMALALSEPCDFCKAKVGRYCKTVTPRRNGVWTLAKGNRTALHADRINKANAARQAQLRGDPK